MADNRKSLTRSLYLNGTLTVAVLTVLVYVLLARASSSAGVPGPTRETLTGTLAFLGVAAVGALVSLRWAASRRFRPLDIAETVANRVAAGDLSLAGLPHAEGAGTEGQVRRSLASMVGAPRRLTRAVQGAAGEAAAMAEEIAASTEEMTASTQEVAGTTGDLTERANQQALIVRAAAEDANKILEIAKVLASGAGEAASRNAALAVAARSHRDRLDASTAELARLADEVDRGSSEADALALAST